MPSLNKVTLLGHLGRDPEVRFTKTQMPVASFSVATSDFSMQNGQKVEVTDWHNVTAWDKLATNCQKYLRKGSGVLIEGRLKNRSWVTDAGEKRYATEIVASNVQFLSKPKEEAAQAMPEAPAFDDLGDIPF